MALTIGQIKSESRQLKPLLYAGEELNVAYYPNSFTPEMEEEQERVQSGMSAGNMLINMCVPLIADWDLMDEVPVLENDPSEGGVTKQKIGLDGKPMTTLIKVPIDENGLRRVPMRVLTDIVKAIGDDLTPGETKSSNSEGTFSRKGA